MPAPQRPGRARVALTPGPPSINPGQAAARRVPDEVVAPYTYANGDTWGEAPEPEEDE